MISLADRGSDWDFVVKITSFCPRSVRKITISMSYCFCTLALSICLGSNKSPRVHTDCNEIGAV